jgi:hypothetical protein
VQINFNSRETSRNGKIDVQDLIDQSTSAHGELKSWQVVNIAEGEKRFRGKASSGRDKY